VENQHANSSRNADVFRRDKACLVYTTSATTTTAQLIEWVIITDATELYQPSWKISTPMVSHNLDV